MTFYFTFILLAFLKQFQRNTFVNAKPIIKILSSAVLLPSSITFNPLCTCLIFKQRFHTLGLASLFKILLWINEFLIRHRKFQSKLRTFRNR
uniref:Uncharacterized protein n=1 Tax=Rhizophora mucronata TaxID=61149 RepID=A0A2P2K2K7_RHIMU